MTTYFYAKTLFRDRIEWPQAVKYIDTYNINSFPEFYTIPKMHKELNHDGTPKTRPIVGCKPDSLQYIISKLLALIIHPLILTYPTVLQNSITIVEELKGRIISRDTYFFTIDFINLYGEIPIHGNRGLYEMLKKAKIPDHFQTLIHFIIENNYFQFATLIYKQLKGIAMGTNVAPDLANLYLYKLLDEFIVPRIPGRHLLYFKRYIDDIFGLWRGTINEFRDILIPLIQQLVAPLEITYNIKQDSIDFLDVTFFKTPNEEDNFSIHTKVYQKPNNAYQYVPFLSQHPNATKIGFIKGELIRYKRICSQRSDYEEIRSLFWRRLRARGYPIDFLLPIFALSPTPNRQNIMEGQDLSVLILDYRRSGIYIPINNALRQLQENLNSTNPTIKLILATRQDRNIGSLLLQSSIDEDTVQYLVFGED
jgi:hypothetical protein